ARDVAADLAVVVVARLEALLVEPGGDTGGVQPRLDLLHGGQVLARIADEHRVRRHLARGRQEARRRGAGGRYGPVPRPPAPMQLLDEALGAAIDAGAHA